MFEKSSGDVRREVFVARVEKAVSLESMGRKVGCEGRPPRWMLQADERYKTAITGFESSQ